ncbi:MAG: hypothetical protein PHT91_03690 [Candidatus Nanoarchaeia archaeon]|nr:hypothetical protein [Candidatus Nanoarchaeia archaeon]MDD5054338.1 hypothetical protein [Candidatus Nanoarchaeia archaeon]MDD5499946.1 hypothetical protein [Candidatus Nanoarchaeia archaeon]
MEIGEKEYLSKIIKLRAKIILMDKKIGAAQSDLARLYAERATDPNLNDFSEMYNELLFHLEERKEKYLMRLKDAQKEYDAITRQESDNIGINEIKRRIAMPKPGLLEQMLIEFKKAKEMPKSLGLFNHLKSEE